MTNNSWNDDISQGSVLAHPENDDISQGSVLAHPETNYIDHA